MRLFFKFIIIIILNFTRSIKFKFVWIVDLVSAFTVISLMMNPILFLKICVFLLIFFIW